MAITTRETDRASDGDDPSRILHIVDRVEFERQRAANERYTDPSLGHEGFIHCSPLDQVLIPANERFRGRDGLVLLVIDVARLTAPLVFEDCYQSGIAFPHVYGPIEFEAVVQVVDFPCGPDGRFELPCPIRPS